MGKLNKHNLAIARLTTKEISRYTLRAIQVTPDETRVTDGHRGLIVSTVPDANGETTPTFKPFLLPRELALELARKLPVGGMVIKPLKRKAPTKPSPKLVVQPDVNGSATLKFGTDEISSTIRVKQEGRFPDLQVAIDASEKYTEVLTIGFNPRLLGELLITMAEMTDSVKLRFADANCPVIITGTNQATGQTIKGVAMPMRMLDE